MKEGLRFRVADSNTQGETERSPADVQKEVLRLHVQEFLNFAEVGPRVGLTRERVRQIVGAAGVSREESRRIARISRERRQVDWRCEGCGKTERRTKSAAARRFCSGACRSLAQRHPSYTRQGDLQIYDPRTKRKIRYERYLAQEHLGRVLRSDEWVVLADADPANTDPSNLLILSPREAALHTRRSRAIHWPAERVCRMFARFYAVHEALPLMEAWSAGCLPGTPPLPPPRITLRSLDAGTWAEAMEKVGRVIGVTEWNWIGSERRENRAVDYAEAIDCLRSFHEKRGRLPYARECTGSEPEGVPSLQTLIPALRARNFAAAMRHAAEVLGVPAAGRASRVRRLDVENTERALASYAQRLGRFPRPADLARGVRPLGVASLQSLRRLSGQKTWRAARRWWERRIGMEPTPDWSRVRLLDALAALARDGGALPRAAHLPREKIVGAHRLPGAQRIRKLLGVTWEEVPGVLLRERDIVIELAPPRRPETAARRGKARSIIYTRERIIEAVRVFAAAEGRLPTSERRDRRRHKPPLPAYEVVLERLGVETWADAMNEAAASAGLDLRRERRAPRERPSREGVIAGLSRFFKREGRLPMAGEAQRPADRRDADLCTYGDILAALDQPGWRAAMEAVRRELGVDGLPHAGRVRGGGRRAVPESELLADILAWRRENGRFPVTGDLGRETGGVKLSSYSCYNRAFAPLRWKDVIGRVARAAGLEYAGGEIGQSDPDRVILALQRFKKERGRLPTPAEAASPDRPGYLPGYRTIRRVLGADWARARPSGQGELEFAAAS